ncbi:MAG TPA: AbrB/MazE/SpoVT family DNA-binding domain-containing protein [Xanthomonadaceae bacterium]|jgi:antitoxin VapB|nr:AbrB/MazE/SpoVT family DNA-binding domain-containing protein [Xanthomonadaceae bacterium]
MTTARLFKLGNAQAVRIPARFRIDADEVEVFKRGDEIILRPKPETAADVFARARALAGDAFKDWERPEQGEARPVSSLDF